MTQRLRAVDDKVSYCVRFVQPVNRSQTSRADSDVFNRTDLSSGAHLCRSAPGRHTSEEMLQF